MSKHASIQIAVLALCIAALFSCVAHVSAEEAPADPAAVADPPTGREADPVDTAPQENVGTEAGHTAPAEEDAPTPPEESVEAANEAHVPAQETPEIDTVSPPEVVEHPPQHPAAAPPVADAAAPEDVAAPADAAEAAGPAHVEVPPPPPAHVPDTPAVHVDAPAPVPPVEVVPDALPPAAEAAEENVDPNRHADQPAPPAPAVKPEGDAAALPHPPEPVAERTEESMSKLRGESHLELRVGDTFEDPGVELREDDILEMHVEAIDTSHEGKHTLIYRIHDPVRSHHYTLERTVVVANPVHKVPEHVGHPDEGHSGRSASKLRGADEITIPLSPSGEYRDEGVELLPGHHIVHRGDNVDTTTPGTYTVTYTIRNESPANPEATHEYDVTRTVHVEFAEDIGSQETGGTVGDDTHQSLDGTTADRHVPGAHIPQSGHHEPAVPPPPPEEPDFPPEEATSHHHTPPHTSSYASSAPSKDDEKPDAAAEGRAALEEYRRRHGEMKQQADSEREQYDRMVRVGSAPPVARKEPPKPRNVAEDVRPPPAKAEFAHQQQEENVGGDMFSQTLLAMVVVVIVIVCFLAFIVFRKKTAKSKFSAFDANNVPVVTVVGDDTTTYCSSGPSSSATSSSGACGYGQVAHGGSMYRPSMQRRAHTASGGV